MKTILLALAVTALSFGAVSAQKQGTGAKSSVKWPQVSIQKWGVGTISLPGNLSAKDDDVQDQENGDVTWTDNTAAWSLAPKKAGPRIFEVNLNVTNWDVPFAKIAPDMKPELATPENFLMIDLLGDMRSKKERPSSVLVADYHTIDGMNGGLTIMKDPGVKNRLVLIWQTFRYYKTKPQRVKIEVVAGTADKASALRIINSLKLEKQTS